MKTNMMIYGTYNPASPNPDGTFTVETRGGGHLWYVRRADIYLVGEVEQKLAKENAQLKDQILNLQDATSSNDEKLSEIEMAFDILRKYL